jgi:hypothetical protein
MKLTKKHLKALIQEELDNMGESVATDAIGKMMNRPERPDDAPKKAPKPGMRTARKAASKAAGKALGMDDAPEEKAKIADIQKELLTTIRSIDGVQGSEYQVWQAALDLIKSTKAGNANPDTVPPLKKHLGKAVDAAKSTVRQP